MKIAMIGPTAPFRGGISHYTTLLFRIDGGSTDETLSVIKKYAKHITCWVSEPDNGQSHALNKGLARATGDIFAWQNSDDLYLPGLRWIR